MGAARWCFVLICHTLLTERERRRERELEEEEQKGTFTDCGVGTRWPRTHFHCLNEVLHHPPCLPLQTERF